MIREEVYLKFGFSPTFITKVTCNKCGHIINAGPNYKPKFCDMCGATITDNLDKVDWQDGETDFLHYVEYLLEAEPDWLIVKVKYECTDYGKIGLPKEVDKIPVIIGKDMDSILEFVNRDHDKYIADDFEPATPNELVAYARTCGKYWRG